MKKIAVLMTMVLLICALPLTAYAEADELYLETAAPYAASMPPATPDWTLAADIISALDIDGTTATCTSLVTADTVVTCIEIERTLQVEGFLWIWSTYKNTVWKSYIYDNSALVSNDKPGLTSGTYRLKTVVTLKTASGKSETITIYSDPVTI
ncbi:MAG: hypothetical protein J1F28_08415 [Oscillospiraceae bacterium]|nr:hypothetical protein [Oscillospiraceae bacterium]